MVSLAVAFNTLSCGVSADALIPYYYYYLFPCRLSYTFGFGTFAKLYLAPYLVVNGYLVLITFLQHTDFYVPHYRASEWNWLRGALSTVDRSFGSIIDSQLHHIADTHVCHHIFSKMPFYHAQEATAAMIPVLGAYYLKDDTPILPACYLSWSRCHFVEDQGGVLQYKNKL